MPEARKKMANNEKQKRVLRIKKGKAKIRRKLQRMFEKRKDTN